MALSLFDKDLNIISQLDDEPNDVGGLGADEFKAKFDEAGNIIKDFINYTLIPEIASDIDSAAQGVGSGAGIDGSKLIDDSVAPEKLKSGISGDKLIDESVSAAKLADGGITRDKLARDAIELQTEDFPNKVVPQRALADEAVNTYKIEDSAVTADKIANNAVSQLYTTTIPATGDGWTTGENYLTYVAPVEGLLSSDNPIVDINLSGKSGAELVELAEAWGTALRVGVNTAGNFYAYFSEAPTVDIPIKIMVVRK